MTVKVCSLLEVCCAPWHANVNLRARKRAMTHHPTHLIPSPNMGVSQKGGSLGTPGDIWGL